MPQSKTSELILFNLGSHRIKVVNPYTLGRIDRFYTSKFAIPLKIHHTIYNSQIITIKQTTYDIANKLN